MRQKRTELILELMKPRGGREGFDEVWLNEKGIQVEYETDTRKVKCSNRR